MRFLLMMLGAMVAALCLASCVPPPEEDKPKHYNVLVSETGAGYRSFTTSDPSFTLDLDFGQEMAGNEHREPVLNDFAPHEREDFVDAFRVKPIRRFVQKQ